MVKCNQDYDSKLIINNKYIFDKLHNKKMDLINSYIDKKENDEIIVIPVSINICLTMKKYNINFIKYCNYIINILNDGFSGNINSKYKDSKYNKEYFKSKLSNKFKDKADSYAEYIYNYINNNTDTKIRFYLDSIEYFDKDFEVSFKDNNTENLINNFISSGFSIRDKHKLNLNINIMKFNCSTLGVSTFPWMKYLLNIPKTMMIFIDYRTIHPEISNNNFNECRTLIHEVGHIFGLRHTFCLSDEDENLLIYKILLGRIIYNKEFNKKESLIQEHQKNPTINNPIEMNDYKICNDIPVNFACFMDYSPDSVLTHFTELQKRIMHYFIKIYYTYLLDNSYELIKKINKSNYVDFYLNEKLSIDINTNSFILKKNNYCNYKIFFTNLFKYYYKYSLKNIDDKNVFYILKKILEN
jgi:hypothetical protein